MARHVTGPQSDYARADAARAPTELLALRRTVPNERADAARNRTAVLDAAARLFARDGVENVSMDAIAAEAGVGKGTLFRRFGDKAGLAAALLDERERDLQNAVLFGPAPLGPGPAGDLPSPADRLRAFVNAYLDYALAHLDLVRMSETASPGARYRIGAYQFWHQHVSLLLAAMNPDCDAEAVAHMVLAPLAAEHIRATVAQVGENRTRSAISEIVVAVSAR